MPATRCKRLAAHALLLAMAALAAACGGGSSPADVRPGEPPEAPPATGPQSFLRFPNPQLQAGGAMQTDTPEYADAYYRAIDPGNTRDTFAKWKAVNGFGTGSGTEINVIFGDRRDLGYGRRINARRNPDGTLAFYVENYVIEAGAAYTYSPLNLEAAIVRDERWLENISAIEFSPGPGGGLSFVKFFVFGPEGERLLEADIDGRGDKAMPGPCLTCHGGRGDALTAPDATGKRLFNLVRDSPSGERGDTLARLQPFEPDVFDYSTRAGYSRADQEAAIKSLNRMILCSYPVAAPSSYPEDACRRTADVNEWQGGAGDLIKEGYGGNGLPNPVFDGHFVPESWRAAGQSALYSEVIAPSCRSCHSLLGTRLQSHIDLASYEKFVSFAERAKVHVFDRGNMPLAKIVYDDFWEHSTRPGVLADFLQARGLTVRDAAGALLRPGRPIADPGPDRVVLPGATVLSAENSLYATAYEWTLLSGPPGATLTAAATARATFTAVQPGTYMVQLVASTADARSAPEPLRIVVDPGLQPAPAAVRFADVKAVMQAPSSCAGCHSPAGLRTPVYFSNVDRNGDGTVGDAVDDAWFYEEVRSRINFTEIAASPLLRKPSGFHHAGGLVSGFDASAAPGHPSRSRRDLFLNWILNGAPR